MGESLSFLTWYCGVIYIYDSSNDAIYYVYYLDENENRILNQTGFYMIQKTKAENGNIICAATLIEGLHIEIPEGDIEEI